jgi:hypothetical protein
VDEGLVDAGKQGPSGAGQVSDFPSIAELDGEAKAPEAVGEAVEIGWPCPGGADRVFAAGRKDASPGRLAGQQQ